MQKHRHVQPPDDEAIVDMPAPTEASDKAETERLLDEIDALLEDDEAERKQAFRDKLRSISFGRRRQAPPPCVGCPGMVIALVPVKKSGR